MTNQKTSHQIQNIISKTINKELVQAFMLFEQVCKNLKTNTLNHKLEQTKETYTYFLEYNVAKGVEDPKRDEIYTKIQTDFLELVKTLQFQALAQNLPVELYDFQKIKPSALKLNFDDSSMLFSLLEQETEKHAQIEILEKLFFALLLNPNFNKSHIETWNSFFNSNASIEHKMALISAVSLSVLKVFDLAKFQLLIQTTENAESPLWQAALVGVVFSLFVHQRIVQLYPQQMRNIQLVFENQKIRDAFITTIFQYIKLLETEKIAQKIKDEIIPEVAKLTPKIHEKLDLDNIVQDDMSEENPDWQDIFGQSEELMDKMGELSQMQLDGSDVFMSTFAQLKNMPFFQYTTNWFIPFNANSPWIAENPLLKNENSKMFETLEKVPFMCNSDKFSFVFNLPLLPDAQKKMMTNYFMADIKSMNEIAHEDKIIDKNQHDKHIITQYLQDLYRFLKINRNKTFFKDFFEIELDFISSNIFLELINNDTQKIVAIADAFFSKKQFQNALITFQAAHQFGISQYSLYQKIAFIYQKLKNYQKALDFYLKAELFDQNKTWNLKKIGYCHMKLKQPNEALKYYHQVEKEEPENLQIQAQIGKAYIELEQYETALDYFYKLEYLNPDNNKVWRPLAWCLLKTGKQKTAQKYLRKIIKRTQANSFDFLNLGHSLLLAGENNEAINIYLTAIQQFNGNTNDFFKEFNNFALQFKQNNITEQELTLMKEYILLLNHSK